MTELKPRMTDREIEAFCSAISGKQFYLEFGTGGSTLLATRNIRGGVVSVESDRAWIDKLKENDEIAAAFTKGKLAFIPIDVGPVGAWGVPLTEANMRNWPKYYSEVWRSRPSDFDVIFIDGRFRVACALMTAACCVDSALIMIHDYTYRFGYTTIEKYFDTVEVIETLVILRRRPTVNYRALTIDLTLHSLNPS
jgi:cellulose biosynthesis protein BcsQ